jgi:alpha-beta hydrolase superfamily lysophospholipase
VRETDPLVLLEHPYLRVGAELSAACARLAEGAPRLSAPFLILHGDLDRRTDPQGSREIHDRAGSEDKTLVIVEVRKEERGEPEGFCMVSNTT